MGGGRRLRNQMVVMKMRKHMLGEEHPDLLSSIANLASMY